MFFAQNFFFSKSFPIFDIINNNLNIKKMETKKIQNFSFKNTWTAPNGDVVHYFIVNLEGEDQPYSLGTRQPQPDFLKIGEELTFEVRDVLKRKIVKVDPEYANNPTTTSKTPTSAYDAGVGAMVGNAITNAVNLVIAGKATVEQLDVIAESICQISINLKNKFAR